MLIKLFWRRRVIVGIDISAKLIYGCNYSDLPEEILEDVDEMLDAGSLDYASPYYDAPRSEWIVGVESCIGGDAEVYLASELPLDPKVSDYLMMYGALS